MRKTRLDIDEHYAISLRTNLHVHVGLQVVANQQQDLYQVKGQPHLLTAGENSVVPLG